MNVLALIQARGGSKGVPKKNLRPLCQKPLIAWTIEAALLAKTVTRVVVSTDDQEIAQVSKKYGAEVPFMRPFEFATDNAKSVGLLKHALEWLESRENYKTDIIVQLKPTNPLRTSDHIDACVNLYKQSRDIDSVITVTKAAIHPLKTWRVIGDFLEPFIPEEVSGISEAVKAPRQTLPEAYGNNSCVHVINPRTIILKNSSIGSRVRGVILSREDSVNIDDLIDFEFAELLMRKRLSK